MSSELASIQVYLRAAPPLEQENVPKGRRQGVICRIYGVSSFKLRSEASPVTNISYFRCAIYYGCSWPRTRSSAISAGAAAAATITEDEERVYFSPAFHCNARRHSLPVWVIGRCNFTVVQATTTTTGSGWMGDGSENVTLSTVNEWGRLCC